MVSGHSPVVPVVFCSVHVEVTILTSIDFGTLLADVTSLSMIVWLFVQELQRQADLQQKEAGEKQVSLPKKTNIHSLRKVSVRNVCFIPTENWATNIHHSIPKLQPVWKHFFQTCQCLNVFSNCKILRNKRRKFLCLRICDQVWSISWILSSGNFQIKPTFWTCIFYFS